MAKITVHFVCSKWESHPTQPDEGSAKYAYFMGTPTKAQLKKHLTDALDVPKEYPDIIADYAGVERWYVGTSR